VSIFLRAYQCGCVNGCVSLYEWQDLCMAVFVGMREAVNGRFCVNVGIAVFVAVFVWMWE